MVVAITPRAGTIPGRTAYFTATMEDDPVGQKTVRFSDLSGQLIMENDAPARIVIHEHPELADSPVEIEALASEASAIEQAGVPVAIVDLYFPGDDQPRRVALEADAFDKLATDKPMAELLATARPARRAPRSAAAQNLRTISLTDPEHVERYGLESLAQEQTGDLFQEQADDFAEERASNAA